jgi:hypothetical protein
VTSARSRLETRLLLIVAVSASPSCSCTRSDRFTYHVEGSAQGVTVTFVNDLGDSETHAVDALPWVLDVRVTPGTEVRIAASAAGPGELRCGLSNFGVDVSTPLLDSAIDDEGPLRVECSS